MTRALSQLILWLVILIFYCGSSQAKQIAFTFDDAPAEGTLFFSSIDRTKELIQKLELARVPGAMIFANPCKQSGGSKAIEQLSLYSKAGHTIGNHTCSHPRLDDVGFDSFSSDATLADVKLKSLFSGQKFFRFPFLNEGTRSSLRDQAREWLKLNAYRNGYVTVDNHDYLISSKMNEARTMELPIDFESLKKIFVEHLVESTEYFNELAMNKLGKAPMHVMLLHERDATVMFIGDLVKELRNRGWQIIPATEAYKDPIYREQPENLFAGDGLIPQLILDKTGETVETDSHIELIERLNNVLGTK